MTRPDPPDAPQAPDGALFDGSEGEGVPAAPPRRRRHPVRSSLIVLVALAVAAAGGIAATGALGGGGGNTPAAAPSGPARTAQVEQTTLTRSETVAGTLGYGAASSVQARSGESEQSAQDDGNAAGDSGKDGADSGSGGGGTLTWLPAEGDVITRGEAVYSADAGKVPLLYGSEPLYRTLDIDAEGADVQLLEKNLAGLGYTGFTVDQEYTSGTAAAVKRWQEYLGRAETGKVARGDAVVASGAKRVAEVKAARGADASGEILTWTGTQRLITVDLETQYEDLVKEGTNAAVKLPDGTEADATVTDIGNAATAKPAGDGGSGTATLPVTLKVKEQKKLGRYQAAPVDVTLAAESRKDILAVPVNALVARKGGGYAVQAVTAGGVENHPVKLGLFANGLVEISGDGITKGMKVGIPQ
ncbi:peptidoglycan-binding protein [Streptomyces sp. NBC_00464]|uniref:peptidoglycan-binding protein n=1 Tax=Streptomyces sp. NBC_00464 TaxID=2975751 RepID=UPI002E18A597